MKYIFYVFLRGYYMFNSAKFKKQKQFVISLSKSITDFLCDFNKNSVVSN